MEKRFDCMNDYINALLNALQFFEIVPALLGTIAEKLTHSSTIDKWDLTSART